jgi:hypothetical protein
MTSPAVRRRHRLALRHEDGDSERICSIYRVLLEVLRPYMDSVYLDAVVDQPSGADPQDLAMLRTIASQHSKGGGSPPLLGVPLDPRDDFEFTLVLSLACWSIGCVAEGCEEGQRTVLFISQDSLGSSLQAWLSPDDISRARAALSSQAISFDDCLRLDE